MGALTSQQSAFYETFGYLKFPGLFAEEIEAITDGFEAIFADDSHVQIPLVDVELHRKEPRVMIPQFIDKHPALAGLRHDPRIVDIVDTLFPNGWEYAESDGNLYWCDSEWHCDIYSAPMKIRHVKVAFYLDELDADNGAVRVIPGTNHWQTDYARTLRRTFQDFGKIPEAFGVDGPEIPCAILESMPGDLLIWDMRTIHSAYFGRDRRRLFTLNFREAVPEATA